MSSAVSSRRCFQERNRAENDGAVLRIRRCFRAGGRRVREQVLPKSSNPVIKVFFMYVRGKTVTAVGWETSGWCRAEDGAEGILGVLGARLSEAFSGFLGNRSTKLYEAAGLSPG